MLNRFYEEMLSCGHYITVIKINVNLGAGCVVCGRCKVFSDCTYASKCHRSVQISTQQQLLIRDI